MEDIDIHDVARVMIRQFGSAASATLQSRVRVHERDGTIGSAAYWGRISAAVDAILTGHCSSAA